MGDCRSLNSPIDSVEEAYFLLNSWLTTFAVAFEQHLQPFVVWRQNFLWLSLNFFGAASLASLFVGYTRKVDFSYLLIGGPLLVVIYLTFKTSMARVKESQQHLATMNTLYLSTIETLAMAIDAKDQVTHGHIRRVQIYAVGLARAVGVKDESDLRAIEAAALLHDMGKLAIPEHILNKPGRLTPSEREKMERHANIGAEILSAIDFPYPVVPIVRHHHEHWDGTGYPAGLRGPEIPLGARVLTVVDCFDALTSDRPYRGGLSTDRAIQHLRNGAGSLFDPSVVNVFVDVQQAIAPKTSDLAGRRAVNKIMAAELEKLREDDLSPSASSPASVQELSTLDALTVALEKCATLLEAGDAISRHLARLVPSMLCVCYIHDESTDRLVVQHAAGPHSDALLGLEIPLRKSPSGWAGLRRETIQSSAPDLDLGERAEKLGWGLRSCLSTPLLTGDRLVGVLTVYADSSDAFTEHHCRVCETVAKVASPVLAAGA